MQLPEGWPTDEMVKAGQDAHYEAELALGTEDGYKRFARRSARASHVFQAMLEAAPTPPTKNPWKEAVEFECTAVNVHFDESNPDDTLMRLMNHYEFMEHESGQS